DGKLAIHVAAADKDRPLTPCTLWLVGYDRPHQTPVLRGENGGRTLTDYQVVRNFRDIGNWTGNPVDITVPAAEADELGNGGVAVLLQVGGTGAIMGAARLANPGS
ncbi:MAG TPA: DUF1223 domain-containing protein, partial [Stellaceae bacterium]|nr:DUF1223 domain-containing protein [Stellaceae bacterium]